MSHCMTPSESCRRCGRSTWSGYAHRQSRDRLTLRKVSEILRARSTTAAVPFFRWSAYLPERSASADRSDGSTRSVFLEGMLWVHTYRDSPVSTTRDLRGKYTDTCRRVGGRFRVALEVARRPGSPSARLDV